MQLAPGVFAEGDELHVDLPVFIRSAGGNPWSRADQETALRAIQKLAEENGIPVEVRDLDTIGGDGHGET